MTTTSSTGAGPAEPRAPRRAPDEAVPVVGGREPCPCGSVKRYKQCHGRAARAAASAMVLRPFEGLAGEPDWVAIRDIVPAASGTARLADGTAVRVASMLPGGFPAARSADGSFQLGMQSVGGSGDLSRDAAAALVEAGAPEGGGAGSGSASPRLQDLLDLTAPFVVTVHDDYVSLLAPAVGEDVLDEAATAALAEASESIVPTARLAGVEAAYWARVGNRRHLRWVLPEGEQPLLDALARLHVASRLSLGEGSRFLGAFRSQGLLVPVWDVAPDAEPDDVEAPAAALRLALDEALAATGSLSEHERRARAGIASRQVTLR